MINAIDTFSEYTFSESLKTKSGIEAAKSFIEIIKNLKILITNLQNCYTRIKDCNFEIKMLRRRYKNKT